MASSANGYPTLPTPFDHDTSVRLPGRGHASSTLLALLAVAVLLAIGVAIILTYLHAVDAAAEPVSPEPLATAAPGASAGPALGTERGARPSR